MTEERSVESRLRRLARGSGYDFHKSRKAIGGDNRGGYMLVETNANALVAGDRFQLTIQDVARELQRLHVLGRR
jgi:hypothetical protein